MTEKQFGLQEIAEYLAPTRAVARMGDNYLHARFHNLDPDGDVHRLTAPMRLDCLSIVVVRHGSMHVEVNMTPYELRPNTLMVLSPSNLFKVTDVDIRRLDVTMIFVSTSFLKDINIDLNTINIRSLIEKRSPAVRITRNEINKLSRYLELLELHTRDEVTLFSTNVARSLSAALFYEMLQINFMRINRQSDDDIPHRRRSMYVHDFMRLVHLNYMQHRTLSFYADQLFISPKYLTVLVKEATGRSATEWINEFVIVEAKNLLRFSGKNIQQVAYALNFPNQSAFGKYFKHLTGISPTAYQKS